MELDVTYAIGLVVTAMLVALSSLFAVAAFANRNAGPDRCGSIFAEPGASTVFLFDGGALVDATPSARAMMFPDRDGAEPWFRLLARLEPMFPCLSLRIEGLHREGSSSSAHARIWSRRWFCGPKIWGG
ncbi:hypothetical protein MASR1M32_04480 [Rhodobacter sp.]